MTCGSVWTFALAVIVPATVKASGQLRVASRRQQPEMSVPVSALEPLVDVCDELIDRFRSRIAINVARQSADQCWDTVLEHVVPLEQLLQGDEDLLLSLWLEAFISGYCAAESDEQEGSDQGVLHGALSNLNLDAGVVGTWVNMRA